MKSIISKSLIASVIIPNKSINLISFFVFVFFASPVCEWHVANVDLMDDRYREAIRRVAHSEQLVHVLGVLHGWRFEGVLAKEERRVLK